MLPHIYKLLLALLHLLIQLLKVLLCLLDRFLQLFGLLFVFLDRFSLLVHLFIHSLLQLGLEDLLVLVDVLLELRKLLRDNLLGEDLHFLE